MDCVLIFRNKVEKDCANQDCRFPRELPDFCAKLGGVSGYNTLTNDKNIKLTWRPTLVREVRAWYQ